MRDSNRLVVTRSGRRERDGAAHANPASRAFMGGVLAQRHDVLRLMALGLVILGVGLIGIAAGPALGD